MTKHDLATSILPTLVPLAWGDSSPQPLVDKILAISPYRDRYRLYLANDLQPKNKLFLWSEYKDKFDQLYALCGDKIDSDTEDPDPMGLADYEKPYSFDKTKNVLDQRGIGRSGFEVEWPYQEALTGPKTRLGAPMRVLSSELSMWAEHKQATATSRSERLEVWVGQRPNARQAQPEPTVKAAVVVEPAAEPEARDAVVQRDLVNLALLLRTLGATAKEAQETIAKLTPAQQGHPAPMPQAPEQAVASSPTPAAQGWGVAYDMSEQTVSLETSTFRAAGQVVTADGRTLDFTTQLSQQRIDVQITSASLRAGDAAKKVDPLVLNLDSAPVAFSGTQNFDVNADGVAETVARLDAGHAYLALDRNGNGTIDDGSELFGPATGNGFAELRAQDSDGNGWIDEGDTAYAKLKLWSPANDALTGLAEAGVGAIALQNVSTPFSVTAAGQTQGTVARTGVYLREDGAVGTVQHVDLAV